jgi:hypothetical protein
LIRHEDINNIGGLSDQMVQFSIQQQNNFRQKALANISHLMVDAPAKTAKKAFSRQTRKLSFSDLMHCARMPATANL